MKAEAYSETRLSVSADAGGSVVLHADTATATSPLARLGTMAWIAVRFVLALFLFVGALQVMKMGAGALDILQNGGFLVRNPGSTLGLGWIGALFVLSGSPVAASSLTLVASNAISEAQGFTMLAGSRLGAAFVVLLVAVVYAFRKGDGKRGAPVSTAIMALSTTFFVYVPGAIVALFLLKSTPLSDVNAQFPSGFADLIDVVYGGLLTRLEGLNGGLIFLSGLGILLVSLKLLDSVVPDLSTDSIEGSRLRWLDRKWPMFGFGCLVALITMSVSVALTVLVPLVAKRYVDRWSIVPYIVGANITTLGDTLFAAFLLDSSSAVRIVIATIAGTAIASVLLLTFFYPQMR